jgi:hypothetical protein
MVATIDIVLVFLDTTQAHRESRVDCYSEVIYRLLNNPIVITGTIRERRRNYHDPISAEPWTSR